MKAFHFRLQRVLDLRAAEAKTQEAALEQLRLRRMQMEAERDALICSFEHAAADIRTQQYLRPSDLAMIDSYREAVNRQVHGWTEKISKQNAAIEKQRVRVVAARARVKLLENLRQKSRDTWQHELDHELEELVADSNAAGWLRSTRQTTS